ncbi:MAG: minor capsid protein [Coriobacteriia bacterium]|nr:minor capsid protein [Coriobacteriia bacterium]
MGIERLGNKISNRGLYPIEVLVLSYAHQYLTYGNSFQSFWGYKYGIDNVQEILNSLLYRGFLRLGDLKAILERQTVPILKEVMTSYGIDVKGNKPDLIQRLISQLPEYELTRRFPQRTYIRTDIGEAEVEENWYIIEIHREPPPKISSAVSNEIEFQSYVGAGIQEYEFLAVLDSRTCPLCGSLDGKIFKLSERMVGVNFPPIHEGCRCTTIGYFGKEYAPTARSARNPKTGKSAIIPNMTYKEWAKKYLAAENSSAEKEIYPPPHTGIPCYPPPVPKPYYPPPTGRRY